MRVQALIVEAPAPEETAEIVLCQTKEQIKIKGTELVIRIPLNQQPQPSASGKTLVVASTHGNQITTAMVNGKPVVLGLNAYIKH